MRRDKAPGFALATTLFVFNALLLLGIAGPSVLHRSGPVTMAAGQDRFADRLLPQLRVGDAPVAAEAKGALTRALREAPMDTGALLRLALVDERQFGRLTPAALQALDLSYARAPADPDVGFWRIQYCLEHWVDLPPALRARVQDEVFGFSREPGHVWPLRILLERVRNPYGAVVARFWEMRIIAHPPTAQPPAP